MAKIKMEHGLGKCVTRSTYQKVCEENKKLLSDIYYLTMEGLDFETIKIKGKWQEKFRKDREFSNLLHEYATKYAKDNPDSFPGRMFREFPPKP